MKAENQGEAVNRHPSVRHVLQFFRYDHLPESPTGR